MEATRRRDEPLLNDSHMIASADPGTDQQSYLYCAAHRNGNFIARGFGPSPFQMNGPR